MADGEDRAIDGGSATGEHQGAGSGSGATAGTNQVEEMVPIGRVRDLQSANDRLRRRIGELEAHLTETGEASATALAAVEQARSEALGHLRRALLAEHAGRVVPELVAGDSAEALEASVETARAAFDRAAEAARTQLGAQHVPTGTPARAAGPPAESLSPLQKIEHGLKTSG